MRSIQDLLARPFIERTAQGKVPWDPALPTSTAHTDAGPWTCPPCNGKGVINSKGEPA